MNCSDPAMKNNPACLATHKPGKSNFNPGQNGQMAPGNGSHNPPPKFNSTQNNKRIVCPGGGAPTANGSCPPLPHKPTGSMVNGNGNGSGNPNANAGKGPSPSAAAPTRDSRGFYNFSQPQHDQFRQRFRSFNFGHFPAPNFTISLGVSVPRSYGLRPLPPEIYGYYPYFRGFLFFVLDDGTIVIVNPRTFQIVAII